MPIVPTRGTRLLEETATARTIRMQSSVGMWDQPPPGGGGKGETLKSLQLTGQEAGRNWAILTKGSNPLCHQRASPARRKFKELLISHVTGQLYAVRILCWVALEVTMKHQRLILTICDCICDLFQIHTLFLIQREEDWLISEDYIWIIAVSLLS